MTEYFGWARHTLFPLATFLDHLSPSSYVGRAGRSSTLIISPPSPITDRSNILPSLDTRNQPPTGAIGSSGLDHSKMCAYLYDVSMEGRISSVGPSVAIVMECGWFRTENILRLWSAESMAETFALLATMFGER